MQRARRTYAGQDQERERERERGREREGGLRGGGWRERERESFIRNRTAEFPPGDQVC